MLQYPQRVTSLIKRIAGLKPGRYVITLTVKDDETIFSVGDMGKLEK